MTCVTPTKHELVGRWMPDTIVTTADGPVRIAEVMRKGRRVLLSFGGVAADATGWSDRVDIIEAEAAEAPADLVLIRPDAYVAWAGSE